MFALTLNPLEIKGIMNKNMKDWINKAYVKKISIPTGGYTFKQFNVIMIYVITV